MLENVHERNLLLLFRFPIDVVHFYDHPERSKSNGFLNHLKDKNSLSFQIVSSLSLLVDEVFLDKVVQHDCYISVEYPLCYSHVVERMHPN